MSNFPCLVRSVSPSGETSFALSDPLVDRYLAYVAGRARAETLRATAFDLKTFFTVVSKSPVAVVAADVFEFLAHQRGDRSVIRISDRGSGLAARTIARRLSSVSGFYAYLVARGDTTVIATPVPRGLSTRRQGGSKRSQSVPLVRVPRTLPTILSPTEVQSLLSALRTHRDRAMILAMLLGGLGRCEVLGLRLDVDTREGPSLSERFAVGVNDDYPFQIRRGTRERRIRLDGLPLWPVPCMGLAGVSLTTSGVLQHFGHRQLEAFGLLPHSSSRALDGQAVSAAGKKNGGEPSVPENQEAHSNPRRG